MGLEWQGPRFTLDHNVAKYAGLVPSFILFPGNLGAEDLETYLGFECVHVAS